MGLFDSLFSTDEVIGIARETIDFALESAEHTHPNEYMGLLRGTQASELNLDRDGQVITDIMVIPGTTSSPVAATLRGNLVPNDRRSVGSIHSHPSGVLSPSQQDIDSFGRGDVHIIMGAPYGRDDWRAFDRAGEPRTLEVLNVTLPNPEDFFDFTQADIDEELYR